MSGGYAMMHVPKALLDRYTYFTLTTGNGYLYRDIATNAVYLGLNTKFLISDYPCTNWIGATNGQTPGSVATITLSNS